MKKQKIYIYYLFHKKVYQLQERSCQESSKAEAVHVWGGGLPKSSTSFSNKINTRSSAAVLMILSQRIIKKLLIELIETPSLREMEVAWFITTQTA